LIGNAIHILRLTLGLSATVGLLRNALSSTTAV
jgi:hypothetical protein